MNRNSPAMRLASLLGLLLIGQAAAAGGLATRDLNPMLQPVFLPAYLNLDRNEGWRIDQRFYLTNTYQEKSRGSEELIIDVENYRYEFAPGYRRGNWLLQLNLPLMANRAGHLDALIEDWHDLFQLPQGGRTSAERDQVNIQYLRDGVVEYRQSSASEGLGDIAVTLGYYPTGETGYFLGVELPSGSETDFSGNEAFDWGVWLQREMVLGENTNFYGLFGVSFPGNGGALEGLLAERVWVAQLGFDYRFDERFIALLQFDLHSPWLEDSALKAFRNSIQIQLGLGIERVLGKHRLDLFFSEDILVGSAPDISFGAALSRRF